MFRSVVVFVALSMVCFRASAQAPSLSSKVISLQEQTDDVYIETVNIQPGILKSEDVGDISGSNTILELSGRLSASLNHLYSLQLISESLVCSGDKIIVGKLKVNLMRYMAKFIDNDLGPVYVGIASSRNLKLMAVYHKLDDILKGERAILDEAR